MRKPGWYRVKVILGCEWECAQLLDNGRWVIGARAGSVPESGLCEIGERVIMPDEKED